MISPWSHVLEKSTLFWKQEHYHSDKLHNNAQEMDFTRRKHTYMHILDTLNSASRRVVSPRGGKRVCKSTFLVMFSLLYKCIIQNSLCCKTQKTKSNWCKPKKGKDISYVLTSIRPAQNTGGQNDNSGSEGWLVGPPEAHHGRCTRLEVQGSWKATMSSWMCGQLLEDYNSPPRGLSSAYRSTFLHGNLKADVQAGEGRSRKTPWILVSITHTMWLSPPSMSQSKSRDSPDTEVRKQTSPLN